MQIKIESLSPKRLKKKESRIFGFKDGLTRLISIQQRYWNMFDIIFEREGEWAFSWVSDVAYDNASDYAEYGTKAFEEELIYNFPLAIVAVLDCVNKTEKGVIQDDDVSNPCRLSSKIIAGCKIK